MSTRKLRKKPCVCLLCAVAVLLAVAPGRARAAASRPIVAVFNIEERGVSLGQAARANLSDLLAATMAASGMFDLVPRDQLRARLAAQKKASYKTCVDQVCQIELGRELAAQKTLATQILKIGNTCALTVTLYDLQRSTSEQAATAEGGCTQDEVVRLLKTVVAALVSRKAELTAPRPPGKAAQDILQAIKDLDLLSKAYGDQIDKIAGFIALDERNSRNEWPPEVLGRVFFGDATYERRLKEDARRAVKDRAYAEANQLTDDIERIKKIWSSDERPEWGPPPRAGTPLYLERLARHVWEYEPARNRLSVAVPGMGQELCEAYGIFDLPMHVDPRTHALFKGQPVFNGKDNEPTYKYATAATAQTLRGKLAKIKAQLTAQRESAMELLSELVGGKWGVSEAVVAQKLTQLRAAVSPQRSSE